MPLEGILWRGAHPPPWRRRRRLWRPEVLALEKCPSVDEVWATAEHPWGGTSGGTIHHTRTRASATRTSETAAGTGETRHKSLIGPTLGRVDFWVRGACRDARFGPKVSQIYPKWEKSGTFSEQISVHFSRWVKMYWNLIWKKVPDLSHLGPIWSHVGPNLTSWMPDCEPNWKQMRHFVDFFF